MRAEVHLIHQISALIALSSSSRISPPLSELTAMRTHLLPILSLLSVPAFAQIPNAGFESWAPSGAGYDDPVGWFTSNLVTYPALSCAEGVVGAPEGSSYAMMTTHTVGGLGVVPGAIFTGTLDDPAFPYAQRPVA